MKRVRSRYAGEWARNCEQNRSECFILQVDSSCSRVWHGSDWAARKLTVQTNLWFGSHWQSPTQLVRLMAQLVNLMVSGSKESLQ